MAGTMDVWHSDLSSMIVTGGILIRLITCPCIRGSWEDAAFRITLTVQPAALPCSPDVHDERGNQNQQDSEH